MTGVPWRRVALVFAAVALAVSGVFVAFRADGFDAVDATVPRATRWFVDDQINALVLVDGFAGKLLAKVPLESDSNQLEVVQGAERRVGARPLGRCHQPDDRHGRAPRRVGPVARASCRAPDTIVGRRTVRRGGGAARSRHGCAAAARGRAVPVRRRRHRPRRGDPRLVRRRGVDDRRRFVRPHHHDRSRGVRHRARHGALLAGRQHAAAARRRPPAGALRRRRLGRPARRRADQRGRRAAARARPRRAVGSAATTGSGASGADGVEERVDIDGLDIDGSDLLAIAGDAGVVVRPGDVRDRADRLARGETLDMLDADVDATTTRRCPGPARRSRPAPTSRWRRRSTWCGSRTSTGELVWAINPWGVDGHPQDRRGAVDRRLRRGDHRGRGRAGGRRGHRHRDEGVEDEQEREPDDDGIDDPPEAFDDQVTARFGIAVPIAVTANDYDPDGDAIAVVEADDGDRRLVTIQSASTVLYSPEAGTVGTRHVRRTRSPTAPAPRTRRRSPCSCCRPTPRTRRPSAGPTPAETRINTPGHRRRARERHRPRTRRAPDRLVHRRQPPRHGHARPWGRTISRRSSSRHSSNVSGTRDVHVPTRRRVRRLRRPGRGHRRDRPAERRQPATGRAARRRPRPARQAGARERARERHRPRRRHDDADADHVGGPRGLRRRGRRARRSWSPPGGRRPPRHVRLHGDRRRRAETAFGAGAGVGDRRVRTERAAARQRRHRDGGGRGDEADRRAGQRPRPRRRPAHHPVRVAARPTAARSAPSASSATRSSTSPTGCPPTTPCSTGSRTDHRRLGPTSPSAT